MPSGEQSRSNSHPCSFKSASDLANEWILGRRLPPTSIAAKRLFAAGKKMKDCLFSAFSMRSVVGVRLLRRTGSLVETRQSHDLSKAGLSIRRLHEPELGAALLETAKSDAETFVPDGDGTSETDGSGTEERSPGSRGPTQRRQVIFIICGLLAIVE